MKRDFLATLGLSDEVIDKVMAEHGKTVNETKSRLTETENELNAKVKDIATANQTIEDLQKSNKDNADLQKQIENYQTKLTEAETQRIADRKNAFIELGLTKAGVKNSKAVTALLDLDKISEGDKGWTGLDEQLEALKESDAYLFNVAEDPKPQPTPAITMPGNPDSSDPAPKDAWAEVAARYN